MINSIIKGIAESLTEEFGSGYKIYADNIEQGLKEPCFFVFCLEPTDRIFLGTRYFRENQMCVQYFPADKSRTNKECNQVVERLFDCLEYITVDGDLTRGTQMKANVTDGVLSFSINYDFFVYKTKESSAMEEMLENLSVKGG